MNGNGHLSQLVHDIELTRAEIRRKRVTLGEAVNPVHRFRRSWNRHHWPWLAGATAVAALAVTLVMRRRKEPYVPPGYVVVSPEPASSGWLGLLAKAALIAGRPLLGAWAKQRWGGK